MCSCIRVFVCPAGIYTPNAKSNSSLKKSNRLRAACALAASSCVPRPCSLSRYLSLSIDPRVALLTHYMMTPPPPPYPPLPASHKTKRGGWSNMRYYCNKNKQERASPFRTTSSRTGRSLCRRLCPRERRPWPTSPSLSTPTSSSTLT